MSAVLVWSPQEGMNETKKEKTVQLLSLSIGREASRLKTIICIQNQLFRFHSEKEMRRNTGVNIYVKATDQTAMDLYNKKYLKEAS